MSQNARTGLIAFGIVGAVIVATVGAVAWATYGPSVPRAVVIAFPSPPIRPPSGQESEDDKLKREIAAHPFWKVKLTEANVDAIVEAVRQENRQAIVFIDDQGHVEVNRNIAGMREFIKVHGYQGFKPKDLGDRYVYFDLEKEFPARPGAGGVLQKLRTKIAVRDYDG